jgi:hypothetical protein
MNTITQSVPQKTINFSPIDPDGHKQNDHCRAQGPGPSYLFFFKSTARWQ